MLDNHGKGYASPSISYQDDPATAAMHAKEVHVLKGMIATRDETITQLNFKLIKQAKTDERHDRVEINPNTYEGLDTTELKNKLIHVLK